MKYAGMPFGMWMLFAGSFQKQLTAVLGYDAATARAITKKAKPQYRQIIAGLPEFEKADRFKMNLVNCAIRKDIPSVTHSGGEWYVGNAAKGTLAAYKYFTIQNHTKLCVTARGTETMQISLKDECIGTLFFHSEKWTEGALRIPKSYAHAALQLTVTEGGLDIVARWFLLISGPRVRVTEDIPNFERQIVRFDVLSLCRKAAVHFLHTVCTFARIRGFSAQGLHSLLSFA